MRGSYSKVKASAGAEDRGQGGNPRKEPAKKEAKTLMGIRGNVKERPRDEVGCEVPEQDSAGRR